MKFRKVGSAAVRQHDAAVAAVIGLAHRGVDADFRGDAGDQQVFDAAIGKDQAEIGGVERALARLVDHGLARNGIKRVDDVVAGFALNENAAHRARIANTFGRRAALDFGRRRVVHVRRVAFARVNDQHAGAARGLQHCLARRHGRVEQGHVIAERLAEAARLQKVALHVDDDERAALKIDVDRCGLGGNAGDQWLSLLRENDALVSSQQAACQIVHNRK